MELQHFSHDHPLINMNIELHVDGEHGGGEVFCSACMQRISDKHYYGCSPCMFFLHKSCAELPREITYPSHAADHSLTLLPNPPGRAYRCDVCGEACSRFTYHCSTCDYDVHIKCASMAACIQHKVEHTNHPEHQLIPLQKSAMFMCDACGSKHEGTSYLCTSCGYWANQKCVSSPTTIQFSHHHLSHPLTLIRSIPGKYVKKSCGICNQQVHRGNWGYCCSECEYIAHINCATSEAEKMETEYKLDSGIPPAPSNTQQSSKVEEVKVDDALKPHLITLPVLSDQHLHDLITQFIKDMRLQQGKYKEKSEIRYVSHEHPLVFVENQINPESCSESSEHFLSNENCNWCALSISTPPFYHCAQCNFFLHEWCAELPDELRHPCHPEHPLHLNSDASTYYCECCQIEKDGLKFSCSACNFSLDIQCASLPRVIIHEAHKHILALRVLMSGHCNACDTDDYRFGFMCDACNLIICVRCALLPRTVRHRYDEHPFILTYSLVKHRDRDEDFCEICLQELNLKSWFYHCASCDQSLHVDCILEHPCHLKPPLLLTSNVGVVYKFRCCPFYGTNFKFRCSANNSSLDVHFAIQSRVIIHKAHKHTLASRWLKNGHCNACHDIHKRNVFMCDPCNFKICTQCTRRKGIRPRRAIVVKE